MELTGQQLIPASLQRTWDALNDPETLKACISGCQSIEKTSEDQYAVVMVAKIGPVSATFRGKLKLEDLKPPHSYMIRFEGQGGIAGFGKGSAGVQLSDEAGMTRLRYNADAQIGGKIAQIGSRLVDASARKIADEFFTAFNARLGGSQASPEPSDAAAASDAPKGWLARLRGDKSSPAAAVTPESTRSASTGGQYLDKQFEVRVTEDVTYGMAGVAFDKASGQAQYRALQLDIYEPVDDGTSLRPALLLACGGAFSRGDRKSDEVPTGTDRNTPTSEYCREFARRGYVCFSIDYRLMQESPHPGHTPTLPPGTVMNADRINFVRNQMGLAPCTPEMMIEEFEAATDDITMAATFVRSRAFDFRIDIDRIAIGGFSAGATVALNATFADRIPVAAAVSLSGRIAEPVARRCIDGSSDEPPVLMFVGENDLPAQLESMKAASEHLKKVAARHEILMIPGASHFYPRTAKVGRAGDTGMDVETAMAEFLSASMPVNPKGYAQH